MVTNRSVIQTTITDPRGKSTTLAYDNLNRVTEIHDSTDGVTAFTYL